MFACTPGNSMSRDKTDLSHALDGLDSDTSYRLRVLVREFRIPPVQDALVLGRKAGIGCYAIRKALHLLMAAPFVHIELDDEVISDLIVRETVLRRFPRQQLVTFVLERIKPLMKEEEILHLEIETEIALNARITCQQRNDPPDRA